MKSHIYMLLYHFSLGLHIILNVTKYVVDLLIPSHMQYLYKLYNDILMLSTVVLWIFPHVS